MSLPQGDFFSLVMADAVSDGSMAAFFPLVIELFGLWKTWLY